MGPLKYPSSRSNVLSNMFFLLSSGPNGVKMYFSYSSSTNDSLPEPHSSNQSTFSFYCQDSPIVGNMTFIYDCTYCIFALPLSIAVLCLGVQRWKQQGASMSHSDFFTYNMAAMELIAVLGTALTAYSNMSKIPEMLLALLHISAFPWNAQMVFPTMICVERYLAVVHPVTYIRLRQTAGLRIRYITTACIWLQCLLGASMITLNIKYISFNALPAFLLASCLITMTFCSLSILRVLIRPRPGIGDRERIQIDKSKQKAFRTVTIITGVLFFRFGGNLVPFLLSSSSRVNQNLQCVAMASSSWFALPSSLILPLLFLQRNRIIPWCK